jgi:hypothetical protein
VSFRGSLVLATLLLVACRDRDPDAAIRAEFGVRYGGDIQDRSTLPLELDASKQELGLRVTFPAPLARSRRLRWEFERPSAERAPDGGVLYAAELGETELKPGERRADAKLSFRKADRPGVFRIRVRVDERVVLERAIQVVAP